MAKIKLKRKPIIVRIPAPFETIDFRPHEWDTVLISFMARLQRILFQAHKYSRFRIDIKMYRVNRDDKPILKKYYKTNEFKKTKTKKPIYKRITAPFDVIDFRAHELNTVLVCFTAGLKVSLTKARKYNRFRIDIRMYQVNRDSKPILKKTNEK